MIDSIARQPGEELAKGSVVSLEGGNIASLVRAEGRAAGMSIVRVGDVGVGDRNAMFLHGSHVGKRNGCRHAIKAGETQVSRGILNGVAVQVRQWPVRADLRRNILVTEEARATRITAGLIGNQTGLA